MCDCADQHNTDQVKTAAAIRSTSANKQFWLACIVSPQSGVQNSQSGPYMKLPAPCDCSIAWLFVQVASSPADVVRKSDITFAMLADPAAAWEVAAGPNGVAAGKEPSLHSGLCMTMGW